MIKLTVDLTPNRHFCNVKTASISESLQLNGFERSKTDNNTIYYESSTDTLSIEENGVIYLQTQISDLTDNSINDLINYCLKLLELLNSSYCNLLSFDTFYIYWPYGFVDIKDKQPIINDYNIKTYQIVDNLYSSIIYKKNI